MSLFTKSIQRRKSKKDGFRICIMRRPASDLNYDLWMPVLAPSHKLLTDYHKKKVDWKIFCTIFDNEVIGKNNSYLSLLITLASRHDVTILCWEDTPEFCHRRLVAEACLKSNPTLKVIIK